MVWLISGFSNWVQISRSDWEYIDSDANSTIDLNFVGLRVFASHLKPEFIWIFTVKIKVLEGALLRKNILVVFLVQTNWMLDMLAIFDKILKIDIGFSNHIIALEEVSVEGLNSELVILIWDLHSVDQSILEVWLTILVSVMGFSLLNFFV